MNRFRGLPQFILIASFSWFTVPVRGQEDVPTITVSSRGVMEARPDLAVLELAIVTEADELHPAKMENDKRSRALLGALRKLGVEPKDVQTCHVYISPRYREIDDRTTKYYEYWRGFRIVVRQLDRFEELFNAALEAGVNEVSSVQFDVTNRPDLRRRAYEKAIAHARQKAQHLAAQLGLTVGEAVDVDDGSYFGGVETIGGMGGALLGEPGAEPTFAAGQVTIAAEVRITFQLVRPQKKCGPNP